MSRDPDRASARHRAAALESADDGFLVARSRDGDVRAFGVLLRRHEAVLRRYAARLTRNAADTDDVLQETAVRAWRSLDSLAEPDKVRAWMIRIVTREALKLVAARRPSHELTDEATRAHGPDRHAEAMDDRRALQVVLDALPQQQARCWILRELGGYTYAEIAERLEIPESTVRGSLAQARKAIMHGMGDRR